ncbi:MAG TPA: DNA topoisomerase IV subunit B [Planctomycetota bacterium]|nr:type IIA DNA topoisomerase subunit B [Planctomycetota bacterium]OQC19841.1 MAG: DNA gyrase subunit B [Planctomycetes bacterium ADurb.Bin069]HNR99455.1 DNA topoisomerase IV subunit B [Planctomycetota bacterium]HNU26356.1 DNA topoisomerase IV subunit B [Planctomycetota bacterium]HOE30509.1 DNA topoisomerase IV subunit B [Planctomycetota bacterium]
MATAAYTAKDIEVLEGLDPVRKRPAMYIGSTDHRGLHQLVWEILDNSVDEVINGYASRIDVVLEANGQEIVVADNGRGIPVDRHEKYRKPALELIMTTLHAGGKFGHTNYRRSGGLHGVGASVVNALSKSMRVTIHRDGYEWTQVYRKGSPAGAVQRVRPVSGKRGTTIAFTPDPDVFSVTRFNAALIKETLEARSYLHKGLKITFQDKTTGEEHVFHHEEGISAYLRRLTEARRAAPLLDFVFYFEHKEEPAMEAAILWTDERSESVQSYTNGVRTLSGGTHEQGLRAGVVKAIRNYMETHAIAPKGVTTTAEDIREGLCAILSTYVPEPQFQGQTKDRLNNPEMTSLVASAVAPALERHLNENRSIGDAIVARIIMAARARIASRQAADAVTRKSAVSHRLNLPGKLADCSCTQPAKSELFIVEGDSAGGTAKSARDRKTQAILPLRGKILNTEQAASARILENQQVADIISALGCGFGKDFAVHKLRYHKIIILTDADSDGHHIATLLLTFFYRHMPQLVRDGYLYIAEAPLYRITIGDTAHLARSDREKEQILATHAATRKAAITRFKGLGEMSSAQLKETAMSPKTRTLLRVALPDELLADSTIAALMGKDVEPRFRLVTEEKVGADELDL